MFWAWNSLHPLLTLLGSAFAHEVESRESSAERKPRETLSKVCTTPSLQRPPGLSPGWVQAEALKRWVSGVSSSKG
jgi:hypothetical protein